MNKSDVCAQTNLVAKTDLPIWKYGFVLYLASLFLTGYRIYSGNQAIQIPLVHIFNDPSLYPNDPFVLTLPHYISMFWRVVALATRVIHLEYLLLGLFFWERAFVVYASGYLAQVLVPESKLVIVGAMALFSIAPIPILGAGTLVTHYFEQTGLSIPFLLLAMVSFYKSRPVYFSIWLGITFYLNVMYGMFALSYFSAVFIFDSEYRKDWQKWRAAIALFILLALPMSIIAIDVYNNGAADNNQWVTACLAWYSPHFLWGVKTFLKFALVVLICLGLSKQYGGKKLFKHNLIWATVSLFWVAIAFLAVQIRLQSLLVLHPARATDLWYCFAGISMVSICAKKFEERDNIFKWATLLFASIFLWNAALWEVSFATGTMVMVLIAAAVGLIWSRLLNKYKSKQFAVAIVLFVCFAGGKAAWGRVKQGRGLFITPPRPFIQELADWAKNNTDKEAVFLIDPEWQSFRPLSQRSVFVTWKDGAAMLWDRSFVDQWLTKIKAFGFDINKHDPKIEMWRELKTLYRELVDEDIKNIKAHYPIDYWIVDLNQPTDFPQVFKTRSYKVLKLEGV